MSLRIHLIRHGDTAWSLSGQHTGTTDIPLNSRGELAARELRSELAAIRFTHVMTSPSWRARHTCGLAGFADEATIDPDLAEWDYGDYEGKCSLEIARQRPDWNLFRDGCPNGEAPAQVSARADCVIARLSTLTGPVALFSHGQFAGVLAARWIGLPITEAQRFPLGAAFQGILGYASHHREVSVIEGWNIGIHRRLDAVGRRSSTLPPVAHDNRCSGPGNVGTL